MCKTIQIYIIFISIGLSSVQRGENADIYSLGYLTSSALYGSFTSERKQFMAFLQLIKKHCVL